MSSHIRVTHYEVTRTIVTLGVLDSLTEILQNLIMMSPPMILLCRIVDFDAEDRYEYGGLASSKK